jgi:hypothetical protein
VRGLAYAICAAFAVLLSFSLHVAARTYEGTVEEDYYRKSVSYFRDRRAPEAGNPAKPLVATLCGETVLLTISPKPVRAMRELVFTVDLPWGSLPGSPWIELGMAAMTMPPNRVELSADGNGRYRGKGAVVRCPGGGKSWTATVHVPGRGRSLFTFDVAD